MNKYLQSFFCFLILNGCALKVLSQTQDGFLSMPLNDLSSFSGTGKNWQTASNVAADFSKLSQINFTKGTGILVNNATSDKSNLVTSSEFGDMELELDFMLGKNTNSGILLQGRYELELTDSWAKAPGYSDCGGISQRWEESRAGQDKGFEGIAPLMNVCRAPGLWQHLKLTFRAPTFDAAGTKLTNARFEEIYLNGTLIQAQAQVTGPTRFAVFSDEKKTGPLLLQGDNGPVAFRNIRYRVINPLNMKLGNLKYRYFLSDFNTGFPDVNNLKVAAEGALSELTWNVGKNDEVFAVEITGDMEVPADDEYTFNLLTQGMGRLYIDDKLVIERITNRWNRSTYTKKEKLTAGKHAVKIIYVKNFSGTRPMLSLSVAGLNTDKVNLHDRRSASEPQQTDPVMLEVSGKPYLLRSFLNYGRAKLTHTISVGNPQNTNYSYDLKQGALIQIWRGGFLDVTDMWVERGEPQVAKPVGSVIMLSDAPTFSVLNSPDSPWPDSTAFDDFQNKGYVLDKERSPTFRYNIKDAEITDKIRVSEQGQSLLREFTVSNAPAALYCRIASGDMIEPVGDGVYAINDKSYYVRVDKRLKPTIRQVQNRRELVMPVSNSTTPLSYSITW